MPSGEEPQAPWVLAAVVTAAVAVWVAVDCLRLLYAIGEYESRIVAVNHDYADVLPAYTVYEVLGYDVPFGRAVLVVVAVAVAAMVGWLHRARSNARRLGVRLTGPFGVWLACVLVTAMLNEVVWWYDAKVFDNEGPWDTRNAAYPLWAAETVMVMVTATVTARLVRVTTAAQQEKGDELSGASLLSGIDSRSP
ncbi:hypothetical protein Vau01_076040 [Virgisporangium aurantiacum]|uniref:Uncharacterized protein n=1 Tax=Virgisporangium aurantiacum TaxID=175570 RepID=A0A8J4E3M0_9ACTN|nr:hypothetical protein Vau01_076040 [Virgisporangium aurantiacum]